MTWLEVVNKDLKELGICKANGAGYNEVKQLLCKCSAEGLLGSCSLQNECLVPAHPDGKVW